MAKKKWFVCLLGLALTLAMTGFISAETDSSREFNVLHRFGPGRDGRTPYAKLVIDSAGNLYGTTWEGGTGKCADTGCGTVFKVSPKPGGGWSESVIHNFTGNDGLQPYAPLIFDQAGNLYGTTTGGGATNNGVVFKLSPNPDGRWAETVVYDFAGGPDGQRPFGGLTLDAAGNLYGTTWIGGKDQCGTAFELTQKPDGTWSKTLLHTFTCADGDLPQGELIFDAAGSLYGMTQVGGKFGVGTAFRLSPQPNGSWKESVLHHFGQAHDGRQPQAGMIFDSAGNLYGTTYDGGANFQGTVFRLSPNPDGTWTKKTIHSFDNAHPNNSLAMDASGKLYGTTHLGGGPGFGTVFQLTPNPDGTWTKKALRKFTGGTDGRYADAAPVLNNAGHLFGTTAEGGFGGGVVFEIVP